MNRKYRLTRSTDFERVRRVGKSYAHPLLVLILTPSGPEGLRFGISAGKSVGGAVQRNRAKRLLREASRQLLAHIQTGWDVVLLARQPIGDASLLQIQNAVRSVFKRAGIYSDDNRSRSTGSS
jgi:ribonuclease P protein component